MQASRMESTSRPGFIQVSEMTLALLKEEQRAAFKPTGGVMVKVSRRQGVFSFLLPFLITQKVHMLTGLRLCCDRGVYLVLMYCDLCSNSSNPELLFVVCALDREV